MQDDFKTGSRRVRLPRFFISLILCGVLLTSGCHAPSVYSWMPTGPDAAWVAETSRFLADFADPAIRVYHAVASLRNLPPLESSSSRPHKPTPAESAENPSEEPDPNPLPSSKTELDVTAPNSPSPMTPPEKNIIQGPLRSIDPSQPMIALTFDDGPRVQTTPQILDILKEYRSNATFFVIGAQVEANRELLIRMAAEGHEIGNHTFSHTRLTTLTEEAVISEIALTNEAVALVTGRPPTLLRPPFGSFNQAILESCPLPIALWSVETLDWKHQDEQLTVRSVLSTAKDGDIVILHDTYSATVKAIRTLVPELIDRGFQLVTVSEMAAARGLQLEAGVVVRRARKTEQYSGS